MRGRPGKQTSTIETYVLTRVGRSPYKPTQAGLLAGDTSQPPVADGLSLLSFRYKPLTDGATVTSPAWLIASASGSRSRPSASRLQSASWAVPLVQTVHILAIGAVIGSGLMIALRTLGWLAPDQTLAQTNLRFLRVIWWTLPVLLVSGLLMISAEPARSLENPAFLLKMGLLSLSIVVNLGYQTPLRRNPDFWEQSKARRRFGQLIAFVSLALWVGVIFSGRWIAYVEAS